MWGLLLGRGAGLQLCRKKRSRRTSLGSAESRVPVYNQQQRCSEPGVGQPVPIVLPWKSWQRMGCDLLPSVTAKILLPSDAANQFGGVVHFVLSQNKT